MQAARRVLFGFRASRVFFAAVVLTLCHPGDTRAECVGCEILLIPLAIPVTDAITSYLVYRHYSDESPSYGTIYFGGLIGGAGGGFAAWTGSGLLDDNNSASRVGLWLFAGTAAGMVAGNFLGHEIRHYLSRRRLSIGASPTRVDHSLGGLELRFGLTF